MRLFLAVKFNKYLPDDKAFPTVGGFEVETKDGKTYAFDFHESTAWLNNHKNIVCYSLKDEDISAFPEIEELRTRLADITKIIECYVDTECYGDDPTILPVRLLTFCLENTIESQEKIPQSTDYILVENTDPDKYDDCIIQYKATDLLLNTFSY